jgi:hypothetical protein
MFGKMKQWFGIEGVKVEMDVPEEIIKQLGVVKGQLRFSTMKTQTVTAVKVTMIETYKRGRKQDKRIDDYQIGTVYLQEPFEIKPDEPLILDFVLPFELLKSEMDDFADKNFLTKGIVGLARMSRAVNSEFRIEVEADVSGTRLNPFDKKYIKII